jgi:hypothetical protein
MRQPTIFDYLIKYLHMDITENITSFSRQPLTHQLLMSWLKDYKRPNDKIKTLRSEGILESVKKGVYIAGPRIRSGKPEGILLANHLLGPSYVSVDTALSYYGLIPERVFEIASMTTKASREFDTPIGLFTYTHLPLPYYAFGLNMISLSADQWVTIASPEKALCDKIVSTHGLILRSVKNAYDYLLENMRMEADDLKRLNLKMLTEWLDDAPKKESLFMVIKMINSL